MGWMSWERFRCDIDCKTSPNGKVTLSFFSTLSDKIFSRSHNLKTTISKSDCINEDLYKDMATRIAEDGFLEAGYNQVSIDDCWPNMERDAKTNRLVGNTTRFPSGIKALGDFMHSKNVRFGIYSDEGNQDMCWVSWIRRIRENRCRNL